jgi:hypothetical protein
VIQTPKTRQEWSDVIDQMSHFGAEASEQSSIRPRLPGEVLSPIKVNEASAKIRGRARRARERGRSHRRLSTTAGTSRPRRLQKVPGLDAAKIEAQKSRIVF